MVMTSRTPTHSGRRLFGVGAALLSLTACAPDLRGDQPLVTPPKARIATTDNGDGTFTTHVNATSDERWVYLDLATGREVEVADPQASPAWDLGFQRFQIKSNGGISGEGDVAVAILRDQAFDTLKEAPKDGYVVDAVDSDDVGVTDDLAFLIDGAWYSYDVKTHTLTARKTVYVVRTQAGRYVKIQLLAYYDDVGTSGHLRFRWAELDPPSGALPNDAFTLDASGGAWVYYRVAEGEVVVSDPLTDAWDLAFRGAHIKTNGGTSGPGHAAAKVAKASAYSAVATADTLGYQADTTDGGATPVSGNPVLGGWHQLDLQTQQPKTKGETYLLRRQAGSRYGKLTVLRYEAGLYTLRVAPVEREVTTVTTEKDTRGGWRYFSFRTGRWLDDVTAPETDPRWDLRLFELRIGTNSGTSGGGGGGALASGKPGLSLVKEAATSGYQVDAPITVTFPNGPETYSGNPALGAWFEIDAGSGILSAKREVFVLRTADGGYAKLQINTYKEGVYTFDWAYAGGPATTFE
ncbi:MAG: hypothetical protein CSA24_00180 [Deltaproteobacteria bacterium]|nr:MAG: hypothetical protein CSB49_06010 [Pseudomonadota bacterium]PIE66400.1 MAG: hypothetical protein CSA24_00180 [Deltaproteobacteria bacterium]